MSVPKLLRSSRPNVFCEKCVLRNFSKFTEKHLCQSLGLEACNFIKIETASLYFAKVAGLRPEALVQVFSCEFWEICKNIFSYRTPPVAASDFCVIGPVNLVKNNVTCNSRSILMHSRTFVLWISFHEQIFQIYREHLWRS